MTADEIRKKFDEKFAGDFPNRVEPVMLIEIAAQLAESNDLKRAALEEHRESQKRNEANQQKIVELQRGLSETLQKNSPPPQIIRVPSDKPTHLGCLVRLPDGTHAIAVADDDNPFNPAMVNLAPTDAAFILDIIGKKTEGKPQ